jgi:hypothetical protein
MPLAIYEPGYVYDAIREGENDSEEEEDMSKGVARDAMESLGLRAAAARATPKPRGSEMFMYRHSVQNVAILDELSVECHSRIWKWWPLN